MPAAFFLRKMVGATRFELVTFCTPSKRATRLRYAPTTYGLSAAIASEREILYHILHLKVNGVFSESRIAVAEDKDRG